MLYDSLRALPLLTTEEEIDLFTRLPDEPELIDEIVCRNFRLAADRANRFRNRGVDIEDLVQEALIGIQVAAGKFSLDVGTKFSTYATWWADHYVRRLVQKQKADVTSPIYIQDHGGIVHLSIDEEGYEPASRTLSPLELTERAEWASRVESAMSTLSERETKILSQYYGLDGEVKSVKDIAEEQGVSKSMIVKIRKRAERRVSKKL